MRNPSGGADLQALISDQFPGAGDGVYANHAAMSPWPRCVAEAVRAFADENLNHGPANYRDWIARERRLREQLAALLEAPSPADIALVKNTTEGISLVAHGLDWQAGDRIVLPLGEFASNRLPWLAQQRHGVTLQEVDIRAAADAETALIEALDDRTRLLTVSAVQWNDGFRLDLERLGAACRAKGVLFFVDAIQQLGALPLDVSACGADFLAADAHKWLLGPEGIAVFYSRPEARARLRLRQHGWHMFENPWAFERSDWTPASSARRFEAGSPNSLGQVALAAALELLATVGPDIVAERVRGNSGWLLEGLDELSAVETISRAAPERLSGIVSFRPRSMPAGALHRALQARGIETSVRAGAIRLSPHFYQGSDELERLLEGIREGLATGTAG
ncbi:aminotransferase class V-fold PLP-dependent enzyme [Elongatibacter sediminis]|uniref:Aminotransferase class V-fold PLP-dependent enzyme n=1 Tax=Elongatibacter sediminis TaxID=3119006 RepID=A0AAW9RHL4_9GAMM